MRGGFIYRENRVSVFWSALLCKGDVERKIGCLLPALLLRSEMFFVRVNRFWCVWTRVLVFMCKHEKRPGFLAMGCLTQVVARVAPELSENFECSDV